MDKSLGPETDKATAYCTYCPKLCRFSCPAAEAEGRETVTPWAMMRLLELAKNGTVEPDAEVAEIFYHCMGCKRCETWCKHDNDVPKAMFEARAWMRELGHVPEALDGFVDFFYDGNSPHPESSPLASNDVFDETSDIVFMPDCETRHHYAELIPRIGRLLESIVGKKVRLFTRSEGVGFACCGFPALAAGDKDGFSEYRDALVNELGPVDYVITDCAAFVSMNRPDGSFTNPWPIDIIHAIEFLADYVDELPVKDRIDGTGIMLHDSCFVGRHLGLYDATRALTAAVYEPEPEEFQFNRENAPCCGGSAHYHVVAPQASETVARLRLEQLDREGGTSMVCGSSTCTKSFRRARDQKASMTLLDAICVACGF